MVSLLGTACSEVTESLAKVAPYWNILQVSYGSTSPALSDRREFPLFFRTVAPDSSHNPARLAFVSRFKWDTVTALSQNEDVFSLAVNDLVTELEQANVSCRATVTFGENDFKFQLRMLRDLDTRIIIGSFSQEVAPKIFCEAYGLGMYGADYAWILQGSPADTWWLGNRSTLETFGCTSSALSMAVEGLLMVSSHNSIVGDDTPSFSGLTNSMFTEELAAQSLPVTKYAPQAYDAVWAIALALRHGNLLSRAADFDYHQKDLTEDFLNELAKVQFLGVSGPVSFSGADRVGISAFYQIQGGQIKKVALYYPEAKHLDFECPQCVPPIWQGGQVPIAKRIFKVRVVTIDPVAFMSISCLAILGICLACAFLGFNLYFRKLKYIKLSSPKLNNMAVIGCILVYMAVILLGLDHATLPEGNFHFSGICTARAYLLSAGFSLAFGSMFTKTYRVHRIFTRSRSGVVKNKMLQDTQLMSLICVLLLMDGLMVTLWVSVDPMQRHLKNLSLEISTTDRSVVYQPQVEVCRSQHTHGWLGALYVYKGLLLVAGLYMAWETRRVQIPALNDSQYIGASVYSVVITSVIVVVLANLISDRATLAFVTITALIFASTTTTLCLLFVPKIHTIWIHPDGDPIVESMGLKIECNTRRFVIDEKREMYYRVEVQNRVYRRELAALDLDISRLERQLSESPVPSTSTNSAGDSPKKVAIVEEESEIQTEESNAEGEGENYHERDMNCSTQTVHLQVAAPPAPRASWPSADPGPRRHVSFGSQPDLDERRKVSEATSVSAIPLPTSSSSSSSTHAPSSVLRRLLHFAQLTGGGDHHGRWSSSALKPKRGLAGTSASGAVAAALRHHVKYVANLVPAGSMAASTAPEIVVIGKPPSSRSGSVVFADPVISITHNGDVDRGDEWGDGGECGGSDGDSEEIDLPKGMDGGGEDEEGWDPSQEPDSRLSSGPRKFSLSACLSGDDDDPGGTRGSPSHEHRPHHRRSHGNARPPPAPSFRERARGSPRFPHKIVPTVACGSMGELRDWRGSNSSGIGGSRLRLKPPSSNAFGSAASRVQRRHPNLLMGPELPGKCRSLDASMDLPHHGPGGVGGGVVSGGGGVGGGSGEPNRVLSKGICLRCGGVRPRRSSSGTCSAVGLKTVGLLKYERGPDRDVSRLERPKCECLDSSRAASMSPNCDVWCVEQADERLQDFIPLSELLVSSAGGGPMELSSGKRTDSQC
ncbi:gamma-aminobutyric acid type B receptor subunit 2-like [Ischnura elegans]|uniref:gamma-aminobutyric acid type B receptor subunit 2-like n=1 Tax=Ischnura elegans TaxID=197161 RepID=UPI001ED88AB5|nr:gamma-aminobutyric acid type B receptor subunit 2-like [Ischnura elegans]